jgi:hypothetical protein
MQLQHTTACDGYAAASAAPAASFLSANRKLHCANTQSLLSLSVEDQALRLCRPPR